MDRQTPKGPQKSSKVGPLSASLGALYFPPDVPSRHQKKKTMREQVFLRLGLTLNARGCSRHPLSLSSARYSRLPLPSSLLLLLYFQNEFISVFYPFASSLARSVRPSFFTLIARSLHSLLSF